MHVKHFSSFHLAPKYRLVLATRINSFIHLRVVWGNYLDSYWLDALRVRRTSIRPARFGAQLGLLP